LPERFELEGFEHFGATHARTATTRTAPEWNRPGDFVLTHSDHWTNRLISFGQMLRFRGVDRKFAYWNHTALIVGTNGDIIEALGSNPGVVLQNLSKYARGEYTVVRIKASPEDRDETVGFARSCLGEPYGMLTIVSIALSLLTGTRFSFGFPGQMICSGLVARALERTRAIFKAEPSHMMPADLAKAYRVNPPDVADK
jgi:permuted papain-like amidase YaeF/Yiix C92 family enzyme